MIFYLSGWVVTLEPRESHCVQRQQQHINALTKTGNPAWEQTMPPRLLEAGLTAEVNYCSSDMDSNSRDEQRQQMRTRGTLQDSELTPGLVLLWFLPCLVDLITYLRSEMEDYLVLLPSIFCYLPFIPNQSLYYKVNKVNATPQLD